MVEIFIIIIIIMKNGYYFFHKNVVDFGYTHHTDIRTDNCVSILSAPRGAESKNPFWLFLAKCIKIS